MKNSILFSCVSHIGNRRKMNQDNFICDSKYYSEYADISYPIEGCKTEFPEVFGVFDGMGGEECGEIASYIAAESASQLRLSEDSIEDLIGYCYSANRKICAYAEEHGIRSTGTTAALIAFNKKDISICNVGDSKIFRFSEGVLSQISMDHVGIGVFGKKPPLSQNLGIPEDEMIIEPYAARGQYKDGDIYIICSDGLTDMVSMDEITDIIKQNEFKDVSVKLLDKALENGGRDNITIILCQVKQKHFLFF